VGEQLIVDSRERPGVVDTIPGVLEAFGRAEASRLVVAALEGNAVRDRHGWR